MKNKLSIHPLQPADTDAIHQIVAALAPLTHHTWYTYWTEITCFGNSCFKALDDETGEIVGFITSHPIATTPTLEWFCWQIGVTKEYRQQGIAITLLEHVIATALLAGASRLQFTIEPGNDASLTTFQHLSREKGFNITQLEELETPSGIEVVYSMILTSNEVR